MASRPHHYEYQMPPVPRPPTPAPAPAQSGGMWSEDEHSRFLEAMQFYPNGPWKSIAEYVGTRTVRQVQTHAQKYHEKIARRMRGLRKERKKLARPEHRIDAEMLTLCQEYSIEHVTGPGIAPPASLWGCFAGSNGSSAPCGGYSGYPDAHGLHQHQHHHHHQCQCHHHQNHHLQQQHHHQQQQHPQDALFQDYRDYDYIAYIEEEFAFRDAEEYNEERAAAAAAAASPDLPSFSDCLDYFIDFFGPTNQQTTTAMRMHRHH